MRSGWKPFWAALGAALLVLLPLVGGTVLLTRHAARARLQTAESQSGVPIALPKDTDRMTLLVCIADEPPGFVLLYLNAVLNCLDLLTLPAETCVAFGGQGLADAAGAMLDAVDGRGGSGGVIAVPVAGAGAIGFTDGAQMNYAWAWRDERVTHE